MTSHPTELKLPESLEVVAWLLAYPDGGIGFYLDGCVAWPDELRANMAASSHIATGPSVPVVRLTDAESALKARDAEIERLRGIAPKDLPTRIQVSYSPDDWDTFIYGVSGHLTIEALTAIDASIHDDAEALFDKGPGEYVLGASYFQGQYGFEGRCEIASGWELEVESFRPLDAAIDQARAEGGEKDHGL